MPAPGAPLELREFERPRGGACCCETLASEVCGTDVHLWKGQLAGVPYPIIPGHVSVGRVAEPDGAADVDGNPLREGQIVTFLDVYGTCGRCWYCTVAHATTRCPHRKVYGVTLSSDDGLLGGWSEYIHLRPGVHVIPLPETLDWRAFMAGGCGMPTALHAVTLAEIAFGDTVVVQGAGPVGLCAAVLAQLRGRRPGDRRRRSRDPAPGGQHARRRRDDRARPRIASSAFASSRTAAAPMSRSRPPASRAPSPRACG